MIFPGALLKVNGAPGNIQGNLDRYVDTTNTTECSGQLVQQATTIVTVMINANNFSPKSGIKFILAGSLLFSVNNILAGLWLNCISSVEITPSSGWHIIAA